MQNIFCSCFVLFPLHFLVLIFIKRKLAWHKENCLYLGLNDYLASVVKYESACLSKNQFRIILLDRKSERIIDVSFIRIGVYFLFANTDLKKEKLKIFTKHCKLMEVLVKALKLNFIDVD